jgi:hypothetical protein
LQPGGRRFDPCTLHFNCMLAAIEANGEPAGLLDRARSHDRRSVCILLDHNQACAMQPTNEVPQNSIGRVSPSADAASRAPFPMGRYLGVAAILAVAVAIRLLAATAGHNYDFDCWIIVAGIMRHGGNVYAETTRYNYGPGWFSLLHLIDLVTSRFPDPLFVFRMATAATLTAVDIGLFAIIWRRYDLRRAITALLSPVAILITGYHGQFDNLAVLLGMIAVLFYESDQKEHPDAEGITRKRFLAYAILGLSLIFKHLFFLFPFYLAIRERTWRGRLWAVFIPVGVFLFSLWPYWAVGHEGIITNIFLYRSQNNAPIWNAVFGHVLGLVMTPMQLFIGALLAAGYFTRRWATMDSLLVYTLVLVGFSSAATNQYLAIVVPAIAVFTNVSFQLYTLVAGVALIGNNNGLEPRVRLLFDGPVAAWFASDNVYQIPIVLLVTGIGVLAAKALIPKFLRTRVSFSGKLETSS